MKWLLMVLLTLTPVAGSAHGGPEFIVPTDAQDRAFMLFYKGYPTCVAAYRDTHGRLRGNTSKAALTILAREWHACAVRIDNSSTDAGNYGVKLTAVECSLLDMQHFDTATHHEPVCGTFWKMGVLPLADPH